MNIQTGNSASSGQPLSFAALCKAKGFASPSQLLASLQNALSDEGREALVEALAPGGLTKVTLGGIWHGTRPAPALLLEEVEKLLDRFPEGSAGAACQPVTAPPDTTTTVEAQPAPETFTAPADWGWDNSADGLPVSGTDIVAAMARDLAPDEALWGASVVEPHDARGWKGRAISRAEAASGGTSLAWLSQSENANHVSMGAFATEATSRSDEDLRGVVRIVLDDVGTKAKFPDLLPTLVIETSPGNYQISYFLNGVERDIPRVKALLAELARLGLTDNGAGSTVRYFRTPGSNVKPEHNGFRDKVRVWAPERRFSLDQIAQRLGVALPAPGIALPASPGIVPVSARKVPKEALLAPGADDEERGNLVARMLECIKNDGRFDSRDDWLNMCFAAHSACNSDPAGRSAFVDWSWGEPAEAERVWDTFKGAESLGFPYLLDRLREDAQHNPQVRQLYEELWENARFQFAKRVFANAPVVIAGTLDAIMPLRPGSLPDNAPPDMFGEPSESHGAANNANLARDRWEAWEQALQHLESARTAPSFADVGSIMTGGLLAFNPSDARPRPIRPDITDFLTRGQVTLLYSAPAVGKSTFVAAVAVALAWEKPDLLGLPGMDWAGDVMVLSNEDGHAVLMDKFTGIVRSSGLLPAEKKHDVLVVPGSSTTLVEQVAGGAVVPTLAGIRFVETLAKRHRVSGSAHGVGLIVIDTLATITAGLNENDAGAMQTAMNVLNDIARRGFLAVLVLHHTAKAAGSSGAVDMFSARGSGAIVASARMAVPMRWPTDDEARKFGWGDTAKAAGTRYVVFDGPAGKANGIAAGLRYYERASYSLPARDVRETGAGGALPPLTISVPVLKPIFPQSVARATPDQAFAHLRAEIAARGRVRHDTGRGKSAPPDGSGTVSLMEAFGMQAGEARALVTALLNAGRMKTETARCPTARRDVQWLVPAPGGGDEI